MYPCVCVWWWVVWSRSFSRHHTLQQEHCLQYLKVMKPPWNCHSLPLNLEFVSHDLLKSDWSTRIQMLAQANYNNLLSTSLIFVFQQQWACWFQHCSVSSAAHQVTHAEWKLLWLRTTLTSPCPHFAIMSKVMHSKPVKSHHRHAASVKWL